MGRMTIDSICARQHRAEDMAFVAETLAVFAERGSYVINGIDLNADDLGSRCAVLAMLETACRRMRQRGIDGHWTYSLPAHRRLYAIYRDELREVSDHILRARRSLRLSMADGGTSA